jgi:hypothetical protein
MRVLEVLYYDEFYDGIFVIYSHEEMLEWFMNPHGGRYGVLDVCLITEQE